MPEKKLPTENFNAMTGTRLRLTEYSSLGGLCALCIEECPFLCDVGKSAFRGREVLYPEPEYFGVSTAGSVKEYGLDWSDIQIVTNLLGALGVPPDPDIAIFPNANVETSLGGVKLGVPIIIAALGSTEVAKRNWDGLAIGSAISGTIVTVGENVCGMDPLLERTNGKVSHSVDMAHRVKVFREFWDGKHGDIVVQTNIEDQRLGVDVYVMSKLEVNIIERKWGQGAKTIGGEVRVSTLERARELKRRGYIVIPDPEDPGVQEAFKSGLFKTFERHSRVGFPTAEGFVEDIERLRELGAKKVFLKTGAYRPEAVAFTMKVASQAKIDAVTFDGAGGGTGMSPVPMMQECSTPTVHLLSQVLKAACILKEKGRHVPDIAMAGGFTNETQIFKAIAMSNFGGTPFVKAVSMARAPLLAVMKSKFFLRLSREGRLPPEFAERYGTDPEKFFIAAHDLKLRYPEGFQKIVESGAIGLYTYWHHKIAEGLRQLMAGNRKFRLEYLDRNDVAALTERAAKVTGLPLIDEVDKDRFEAILLD